MMKKLLWVLILAQCLILATGCSKDPPRVRVNNLRPEVVDVQLKPPSGATINLNDVGGRSATGYIEVPTARYEVDVNVEDVSESATTFFTAEEDQTYSVVVLDTDPPTVRVDKP